MTVNSKKTGLKKYGLLGWIFYSRFAQVVSPLFLRLGISPNVVTLLGLGIFAFGAVLLPSKSTLVAVLGVVLINLGIVLDYADGIVARVAGKSSFFGAWLDNTIDRLCDFMIVLPVAVAMLLDPSMDAKWIQYLVPTTVFLLCFSHYAYDIGYFFRASNLDQGKLAAIHEVKVGTLPGRIVSGWLTLFNRDTVVLILCLSHFGVSYLPYMLGVFLILCINLVFFLLRELVVSGMVSSR